MQDINVHFIHPFDGRTLHVTLDDSITAQKVIAELIAATFIAPNTQGYSLAVKGGNMISPNQSFKESNVCENTSIRIIPATDAGGMDFSLHSFESAFSSVNNYQIKEKALVFAFVLATPADSGVFPDLLVHMRELHQLAGERVLVIAPRIGIYRGKNKPNSVDEALSILSSKRLYDFYSGQNVDVSWHVERFLQEQTAQTYDFARFIELPINEIPCVVFFDSLDLPDKYIRWSLQGTIASDVVRDFRTIVAAVENLDEKNSKSKYLDTISKLDQKRFAVKILKSFGKAVPVITSFIAG